MKYLKTYFTVVFISLFIVGLINFLVDPLWYFQGNRITGINPPWNERIAKTNLLLNHQEKYDCLLLGTSRSTLFNASLLKQNRCFNYSFSGGKLEEYVTYLTYLHEKGIRPQKVYIEIELSSFDRRKPRVFEAVSDPMPVYRAYLFSGNVLQLSLRTLTQDYEFARLYDQNFRGMLSDSIPTYDPELLTNWEQDECDPQRLEFFQKLRQIFPDASFVGFVAPVSGWVVFNDSYTSGLLDCQLAGIHQIADFFDQVYDFSVPSPMTTQTDNTYDGDHYYPRVYRLVAKRLEGGSADFGVDVKELSLSDYQTFYLARLNRFLARENHSPVGSQS